MAIAVELDILPDADGSARFYSHGVSVLAAVNGPLEVQRRDELPDEATLDVSVRPSAGLAGIRERFFESLIHKTLRQVIRTNQYPRTLIQITLQVTASSEPDSIGGRPNQAASLLHLMPPLLNAAMLALLCSSIPLSSTFSSVVVVVTTEGQVVVAPSSKQLQEARSIHMMAYSSSEELILLESEGSFNLSILEECLEIGKRQCMNQESEDMEITDDTSAPLLSTFREVIEKRINRSEDWKRSMKG